MKKLILTLLASIIFTPAFAASEPVNLAFIKKDLVQYHDSHQYANDIGNVMDQAIAYLQLRLARQDFDGKKPAIILDIDETSLSNYPSMRQLDFGGSLKEIMKDQDKAQDPVIEPTLELYRLAKANHVAVFFLTGRYEYQRATTSTNLTKAGYQRWDGLILRSKGQEKLPAAAYKSAARKKLIEQGYDIILSIGDQNSDFAGGYADKTYKLPNPYYFIP